MKIGKKAAMGISLAIGTLMFASTAFAEVSSKNGYEQLKDAFKFSADSCSSKFNNYTINTSFVIKDSEKILSQEDTVQKYDISKNAVENTSSSVTAVNPKMSSYYYSDPTSDINYDSGSNSYKETDYKSAKKNSAVFNNPFKNKGEADIEKILDAVVGNLKDYVVVNQKPDGTRELSGSISEAQIPAIANALVSYEVKNIFGSNSNSYNREKFGISKIAEDIYVKQIKGDVVVNKDGLLQTVTGTGIISGKDEQGKVHEFTFEVLGKLTEVNSTVVKKPDLTGKNVEKSTAYTNGDENPDTISNPQMFIGTYKNDIVINKDNKFQKIGERILEITSIDSKKVSGKYHEEYTKGNEQYFNGRKDFKFDASFDSSQKNHANFQFKDEGGTDSGNIDINTYSGLIFFSFSISNNQNILNNDQYSRVFN